MPVRLAEALMRDNFVFEKEKALKRLGNFNLNLYLYLASVHCPSLKMFLDSGWRHFDGYIVRRDVIV